MAVLVYRRVDRMKSNWSILVQRMFFFLSHNLRLPTTDFGAFMAGWIMFNLPFVPQGHCWLMLAVCESLHDMPSQRLSKQMNRRPQWRNIRICVSIGSKSKCCNVLQDSPSMITWCHDVGNWIAERIERSFRDFTDPRDSQVYFSTAPVAFLFQTSRGCQAG